jgi:hypothetical protein
MSSVLVALAAVWLAGAFHLLRDPCSRWALVPPFALGLAALALRRPGARAAAQIVLGAGLAGALAMHLLFPPVELPFARLAGYRGFAILGLVLASAYLCLHLRASLQRARFLLLVACFVVLALAAAPSWGWTFEAVELMFAALFVGQLGGQAPQLAAALMLFGAPLGAPYGPAAAALLALWSALLYVDRPARWPRLAAPLAGCGYCAAGLLWPTLVCEGPALGVGLFCAAAALEGAS